MTLDEIQALVVSADPDAGHYESAHTGSAAYTVWQEYRRIGIRADDAHGDEAWTFQIDRFTKNEHDDIADAIFAALDADPRVAFEQQVDFEPNTGYIHHIFDCEGA